MILQNGPLNVDPPLSSTCCLSLQCGPHIPSLCPHWCPLCVSSLMPPTCVCPPHSPLLLLSVRRNQITPLHSGTAVTSLRAIQTNGRRPQGLHIAIQYPIQRCTVDINTQIHKHRYRYITTLDIKKRCEYKYKNTNT